MNSGDAAYVGAVEQQHSAHTGGKDPGQGPGQGQEPGKEQRYSSNGEDRRRPSRGPQQHSPKAAASPAGPAGGPSHGPASKAASSKAVSSKAVSGGASTREAREARRRIPASGAVRQEAAALYQAQLRFPLIPAPLTDVFSWLPRARLTALGCGLLGVLLMLLASAADKWLLGGSPALYGGAFLVTSLLCACWVRPTDLVAAPVAVPLAFTAGLFLLNDGTPDQALTERVTNLFPALAVNAVWLYAGTLLAVLVVAVRKVALMVQQSRVRALMEAEDAEDEAAEAEQR